MRAKREFLGVSLVVTGAAIAALLLVLRHEREDARVRVAFEQAALERLWRVSEAQKTFHAANGHYAWADDLRAAGLLDNDRVAADGAVLAPRYRIDVLLPTGLDGRDLVQIAPRGASRGNPLLAKKHFAVVARPSGPERTGHRSFYLDESGQLYVSEGVTDVGGGGQPPLPDLHLSQSRIFDLGGLRWWEMELAGQG